MYLLLATKRSSSERRKGLVPPSVFSFFVKNHVCFLFCLFSSRSGSMQPYCVFQCNSSALRSECWLDHRSFLRRHRSTRKAFNLLPQTHRKRTQTVICTRTDHQGKKNSRYGENGSLRVATTEETRQEKCEGLREGNKTHRSQFERKNCRKQ